MPGSWPRAGTRLLRQADALMAQGVRLADPAPSPRGMGLRHRCGDRRQLRFRGGVGRGVRIGANCVIANARIAADAVIHPFTHIDGEKTGVTVGEGALASGLWRGCGPGAQLGAQVHIGNFVEVKNLRRSQRGGQGQSGCLFGRLPTVGARVINGAGSITANYDGVASTAP